MNVDKLYDVCIHPMCCCTPEKLLTFAITTNFATCNCLHNDNNDDNAPKQKKQKKSNQASKRNTSETETHQTNEWMRLLGDLNYEIPRHEVIFPLALIRFNRLDTDILCHRFKPLGYKYADAEVSVCKDVLYGRVMEG